jgi:Bacterial Ig domain
VQTTSRAKVRRPRPLLAVVVLVAAATGILCLPLIASPADARAPDTKPPSPPTDLRLVPISSKQINLTWGPSTDDIGVDSYEVIRDGKTVATPKTTLYNDTGLGALKTYEYAVRAVDAAGNKSLEAQASATTPATSPGEARSPAPSADKAAPTVSLTEPQNGTTVSGKVKLSASASDDVKVRDVQFLLDGKPIGAAVKAPPYSISWDTSSVTKVAHTLTARASDTAGKSATSDQVNVTVAEPDTSPPTAEVTSPKPNAEVNDVVTFAAEATDESPLKSVQLLVDGLVREEPRFAPYALEWNSREVENGSHTLAVRAEDVAGNLKISNPVTVNVANDMSRCGVTGGRSPTASILRSEGATEVMPGEEISFRAAGADPDCGPLQDGAYNWQIDAVSGGKTVPVESIAEAQNISFRAPDPNSLPFAGFEANTRYHVTLEATNQRGQKATSFADISPRKVQLQFNTDPVGPALYINSFAKATPFTLDTLVGTTIDVEARDQTIGGSSYKFKSWSDHLAQRHVIVAPTEAQTYTATYTKSSPPEPVPIEFKQQSSTTPPTSQSTVSATYAKAQTAGNLNIVTINWHSDKGTISKVSDEAGEYKEAASLTPGGGNLSQAIYYRKITEDAPAGNTVTVTFDAARLGIGMGIAEYSGIDPDHPVDATSVSSIDPNDKSAPSGSVRTTAANTLLVAAVVSWAVPDNVKVSWGTPVNEKECVTRMRTGNLTQGGGVAAECILSTVDTYKATASLSSNTTWLMQLVAFRGAS